MRATFNTDCFKRCTVASCMIIQHRLLLYIVQISENGASYVQGHYFMWLPLLVISCWLS